MSLDSAAVIAVVALLVPLGARLVRLPVPEVVLEIVAGIVIGPALLGWAQVDEPVRVLSVIGLAFLLFLAGPEIDLARLRGRVLLLTSAGFTLSFVLALGAGQVVVGGASVAEVVPIVLLSVLFSESSGGITARVVLLGAFVVLVAVLVLAVLGVERSPRVSGALLSLQGTTAEIRLLAAGLLQAVSLSIPVVAGTIGVHLGLLQPENYAALVAAGLVSVIVFPLVAVPLLRAGRAVPDPTPAPAAGVEN